MNKTGFLKLAKNIIKNNIYMSLGTVTYTGEPWVSPVCYFIDKEFNFYYASQMKSVHTKNIIRNSNISFAIFDSQMPEGTGVGVQSIGNAKLLKNKDAVKALKLYKSVFITEEMFAEGVYRLFKIKPKKIYVTDPDAKVDRRVEIPLRVR